MMCMKIIIVGRNIEEYNSLLLKGGSEDWNKAVLRDGLVCHFEGMYEI